MLKNSASKEELIKLYKEIKSRLGHQPSKVEFCNETGISKNRLDSIFGSGSFNKLVSEAGDIPNSFFHDKSNFEEILIKWGSLARLLGKLPTQADWKFYKYKPTVSGIEKSHNLKWSEIPYKFLEFASELAEWKEVIPLIPKQKRLENIKKVSVIGSISFELLEYVPPIVQDLVELSINESKAIEFEKKVNLVFQMFGFEVETYGQGTGRNPDGIAKENQHRYAILIDAKSRQEGYKIGTEDRKFIEYIETYSERLLKAGYSKIYFLIVSSRFNLINPLAIQNIKAKTNVTTSLITSELLLEILAHKIRSPRIFDLKEYQQLFIEGGIISKERVIKFLRSL